MVQGDHESIEEIATDSSRCDFLHYVPFAASGRRDKLVCIQRAGVDLFFDQAHAEEHVLRVFPGRGI
jgi:hypothetical protein